MNCDICGCDSPTVHLTEIVDGKVRKLNLCAECAEKSGVNIQDPSSIPDILLGLNAQAAHAADESAKRCSACHMRWADYKKSTRLGCPACYASFDEELRPLLAAMHKGVIHKGKAAAARAVAVEAPVPVPAIPSLAELKRHLKDAVVAEDYEMAASLRDQIHRAEQPADMPQ